MGDITTRRNKDGSTSYLARIRRRGTKTLSASFSRKTDAKKWLLDTESAVIDGRYFDRSEDRKHTLGEAIERHLLEHPTDGIRKNHLKLWNEAIGHLLLSAVTPVVLSDVLATWARKPNKRGEKRGGSVLNRYSSSLSVVFTSACRDWGWVNKNPVSDLRRFPPVSGKLSTLGIEK